jgi:predicted O-linked N-acetylglucosamine transferase (SPINDLY family)/predicted negative regulator of RcsB-dependent stress response
MTEQLLQTAHALHRSGNYAAAERLYGDILRSDPNNVSALLLLGYVLLRRGALNEALTQFDRVLSVQSGAFDALIGRGAALCNLNRHAEALTSFDRALGIRPRSPQVHSNRGNALLALGRGTEALQSYERAVTLDPAYVEAWSNRAIALLQLSHWAEALESFRQVLVRRPDHADAWEGSAAALVQLDRRPEAIAAYDRVIELRGPTPELLYNRGNTHAILKNYEAAIRDCEMLLSVAPDYPYARGVLAHARMQICDWRGLETDMEGITQGLRAGKRVISPFNLKALSDDPEQQLRCAELWVRHQCPPAPTPLSTGGTYEHERIRIAYVSGDFGNTAVGGLMAPVLGCHGRKHFEVIAVSFGPPEKSTIRQSLESSFDRFVDVASMSDFEIASWMRNNEIDVAVDLMGFTGHCRSGIFAHRPAPVQVNFLGFPGSLGAPYFDYIIADPVVIRDGHERYYAEKTVLLPNCYLPADPARLNLAPRPPREAFGLPASGIVFASFNNSYKFSPAVFACWLRILRAIDGSVLWLSQNNPGARANLVREASAHEVRPERLIFAPPISAIEDHLARLSVADIFLDTSPYNSHSTAIDALTAGVPLITTPGNSFASRVAASCLNAVGLRELATDTMDAYENLAVALARDSDRLLEIRNRLAANIPHSPLFNVQKFTRDLEAAFATMWRRSREGATPVSFAVPV